MSERYTNVFSLPKNLYATGAPVVISAGALLKENPTGTILAQLKIRNISPKTIIGVRVRLRLFDNFKTVLGDPMEYEYLDLRAARDAEFGQKCPIPIPERKTRLCKVTVTSVVFADHSIWNADGESWKPLGSQALLMPHDPQLLKQYKIQFGSNSAYMPLIDRDLWFCTCGALNRKGENCHKCRNSLSALQAVDMAALIAQKNARLAREAAEAAAVRAAQEAAAAAKRAEQEQRKQAVISAVSIPVVAAKQKSKAAATAVKQKKEAVAAAKQKKKEAAAAAKQKKKEAAAAAKREKEAAAASAKREKEAAAAVKKQQKEAAVVAKQKSPKKRRILIPAICAAIFCASALLYFAMPAINYSRASSLMDAGQFEQAIAAFEALNGYKDSLEQIESCREGIRENCYREAIVLTQQGAYTEAFALFLKLGDYKDSGQWIAACESASEEVTYLSALERMEQQDFAAAREKLRRVMRYKDSLSLLRTCNQALGTDRKEKAAEYADSGKYMEALLLLQEAESYGLDCETEIRQCELSLLSDPHFKRYAHLKPLTTRGKPVGRETRLYPTTQGGVTVYSMTRVELDNGCVRFTIDCKPVKSSFFSVFNPPNGSVFRFLEEKDPTAERQTIVFDILKEDVKAADEMTIGFGDISSNGDGGWIYVRNLY